MQQWPPPDNTGSQRPSGRFRGRGKNDKGPRLRQREVRFIGTRLLELLFAPIAHLPIIIPATAAAWLLGKGLGRIWEASFWPLVAEAVSLVICLRLFWLLLRFVRRRIHAMAGLRKYCLAAIYSLYIAFCYAAPGWLAGAAMLPESKSGRITAALCTSVVGFIFYCRNMGLSSPLLRLLQRVFKLPPSPKD